MTEYSELGALVYFQKLEIVLRNDYAKVLLMVTLNKRQFLSTGAALALNGWSAHGQTVNKELPALGSRLIIDALPLLNDDLFQPQNLNGRWLVLYYWASWCPFCAQQTPEMQKLHDQVKNKGMTVLGISIDKQLQNAKTHFQKHNYTFASIWLNPSQQTRIYKPTTIPTTLVYNPQSLLIQADKGQMFSEDIENLSKYLM
jgi:peroxiredoxin